MTDRATRPLRAATVPQITIRMYNVGFGDCFLVRIPCEGGERKVLFDCGTISGVRPIADVVAQVVRDVTNDGVARIDVVVGTHRHRDHVSGFSNARWAQVEVGEVWMPWTEDPKSLDARRIRETQSRLAASIHETLTRRLAAATTDDERKLIDRHQQLAANALSNESAMRTLHEGFATSPVRRFLPTLRADDATFTTNVLTGVTIHVMGPSRNEKVIRDMEPPAGQSYLVSLDMMADGSASPPPNPFRGDWWVEPAEYQSSHLVLAEEDKKKIGGFDLAMEQAVATSLDKAVNGTSLMLMFQIGDLCLLFPGDAQWGTWQAALQNPDWAALLKRTTFYKIGHHGSHNATPPDFIKGIQDDDFWAMVSTGSMSQWPLIPRDELLKAITDRTTRLTRSDKLPAVGAGARANQDLYADITIPLTRT